MEDNNERLCKVAVGQVTPIRIQPSRRAKRVATDPKPSTPKRQTPCDSTKKRRGRPRKQNKENDKEDTNASIQREVDLIVSHGTFSQCPTKAKSKRLSTLRENLSQKCISMDECVGTDEVLHGSADKREKNSKAYFECYKKAKGSEYSLMIKKDSNKNASVYESFSIDETKYDSFDDSLNEEPEEKLSSNRHFACPKTRRRKPRKQPFYDSLEDVCSTKSHKDKCSFSHDDSNVNLNTNLEDSLISARMKMKHLNIETENSNMARSNYDDDSLAIPDIESTFDDSIEEINMVSSIDELNDMESLAETQIPDLELCSSTNQHSGFNSKNNVGASVEVIYEKDGFLADDSDKLSDSKSKLFDSLSDSGGNIGTDMMVDSLDESRSGGCASSFEQEVNKSLPNNEPEKIISITADEFKSSAEVIHEKVCSSRCEASFSNSDCYPRSKDDLKSFMDRYSSKGNVEKASQLENSTVVKAYENYDVSCSENSDLPIECFSPQNNSLIENASSLKSSEGIESSEQIDSIMNKTCDVWQHADVYPVDKILDSANSVDNDPNRNSRNSTADVIPDSEESYSDSIKETITVDACQLKFLNDKFNLDQSMKFELEIEVTVGDKKCKLASENVKIIPVGGKKDIKAISSNFVDSNNVEHLPIGISPECNADNFDCVEDVTPSSVTNSVSSVADIDVNSSKPKFTRQFSEESNILGLNLESNESVNIEKKSLPKYQNVKKYKYVKPPKVEKVINSPSNLAVTEKLGSPAKSESSQTYGNCSEKNRPNKIPSLISPTSESKSVSDTSESKSVSVISESKPVSVNSESKPVSVNSESKPVSITSESKPVSKKVRPSTLCVNGKEKHNSCKDALNSVTSNIPQSEQVVKDINLSKVQKSTPNKKQTEKKSIVSPMSLNKLDKTCDNVSPSKIQRFYHKFTAKQNDGKMCAASVATDPNITNEQTNPSDVKANIIIENKSSHAKYLSESDSITEQARNRNEELSSPRHDNVKGSAVIKSKIYQKQKQASKYIPSPTSESEKEMPASDKNTGQGNKPKPTTPKQLKTLQSQSDKIQDGSKSMKSPIKSLSKQNDSIKQNEEAKVNAACSQVVKESTPSELLSLEKLNESKISIVSSSNNSEFTDASMVTCESNLSSPHEGDETEPSESEEFVSCPESPSAISRDSNVTRRTRGNSSYLPKDMNVKCGMEDNSLLLALDLHDISMFLNETTIQSNDSLMPLNLCYKDDFDLPDLCRDESKENVFVVPAAVGQDNCFNVCPSDGNKTPRYCKEPGSKETSGKTASGTKIPIRKIPMFPSMSKKPFLKSIDNKKKCDHNPSANGKNIPSPSPHKKHHFCTVRNTIFSKVPQIVTPKRFNHIQSPVAQYIRHGQHYPLVKNANEPVLRDCMNNLDFNQPLDVGHQVNMANIMPQPSLPKLKRKL